VLPNHPLELRDRGLIYYQLGSWQKAQQDLRLYLALLPGAQDAEAIRELLQNINN
jgi:regulator of sirC expression with transglutaminase-like and TPR domain